MGSIWGSLFVNPPIIIFNGHFWTSENSWGTSLYTRLRRVDGVFVCGLVLEPIGDEVDPVRLGHRGYSDLSDICGTINPS